MRKRNISGKKKSTIIIAVGGKYCCSQVGFYAIQGGQKMFLGEIKLELMVRVDTLMLHGQGVG